MSIYASTKTVLAGNVSLTTGGTVTLSTGTYDVSAPASSLFDGILAYRVVGTQTLASNFSISPDGNEIYNAQITVMWEAACTPSGNTVTIFGQAVPEELLDKDFHAVCTYDGSAWKVVLLADWAATSIVNTNRLEDASVTTAKIVDANVTTAKVADANITAAKLAADSVETAKILDANVTAAKLASDSVTTVKILDANVTAAKLASDAVETAKIKDGNITKQKIAKPQRIYSKYSDTGTTAVTTEEALATYTLPAGYVANDGESIRITATGTFAANTHVKTLKVKVGTTVYATNAVTTSPNAKDWKAEVVITRSGATSAVGHGIMFVDATAPDYTSVDKSGITWANANDITVTGQNGTATVNDTVCGLVLIEHLA